MENPASSPEPSVPEYNPGFIVSHQKIDFDVNFLNQTISGRTEITILPRHKDLRQLRFHARQFKIKEAGGSVTINGKVARWRHDDPAKNIAIPEYVVGWTAAQADLQKERLSGVLNTRPTNGDLVVEVPRSVRIEDVNPFSEQAPSAVRERALGTIRVAPVVVNGGLVGTPTLMTPKTAEEQTLRFAPLTVSIPFVVREFRQGAHWVGVDDGDMRYPHVYTRHSILPGTASCIFPCIDDPAMRCTWDISVKCGRTLGDALRRAPKAKQSHEKANVVNGTSMDLMVEEFLGLTTEDKLLEMNVVCAGELTSEMSDPNDASKKIVSFLCTTQVAPMHIGFAVGPFEQVDLSEYREEEGNDKLGQKAVKVYGYCLPGRTDELRNTCEMMAFAVDWFSLNFGSYPFPDYKLCFVDNQILDTVPTASMTLCSTRLLIPEEVIDPEVEVTRKLIHALASQWIGVSIVANSRADTWVIIGVSHFITDLCLQKLCGNNDYRFRQKTNSDKLVELDIQRPSLYALGEILHLGQFEMEFMVLKAPLVLFILDRRLTKLSGSTGLARVISRMLFTASTGEQLSDKTISTQGFQRLCEKIGHAKLDAFFNQWVLGAGCPRFSVTQKFNKKRLIVEMTVRQTQETLPSQRKLQKEVFQREFKEETSGIYAGEIQPCFTGPMTIRIHESDGTPYEHIVEIREAIQKIEIPYHTKYKRLKKSRREKERATAGTGVEIAPENQDDVLLYCLGDVLQGQNEIKEWKLSEWDTEQESKMEAESYEWIRMDADFEWICELSINMPSYMYLSQLQQDRDVVAQQDSMLFLGKAPAHQLVSTILIRTLMDRRYFHGIREMAAKFLSTHAVENIEWLGQHHLEKAFHEFFCYPGSEMPRTNDFTDKTAYFIKCAIPTSIAQIRDSQGRCPAMARQFILDQLRFNDNGNNEFSDHYYICTLLKALADCLIPRERNDGAINMNFEDETAEEQYQLFVQTAIDEIDRYRRMDEWIESYQNIYTTTALTCIQRLMKAKVTPPNAKDFIVYTHDGTADLVRIKAFEALVDLGFLSIDSVASYFLAILSTDSSPYVRERMFQIFGLGQGAAALAEKKNEHLTPPPEDGGLIVEHDMSMEAKKDHIARTTSIEGALIGLSDEWRPREALKKAIWRAVESRDIGPAEQADLLDLCHVLYDSKESMVIKLKYPRKWKVRNLGKGRVLFSKTGGIRTTPRRQIKIVPKPAPVKLKFAPATTAPAPAPIKAVAVPKAVPSPVPVVNTAANSFMRPPKRPLQSERTETSSSKSQRPRKIVKLSIEKSKLQKWPHSSKLPQASPQSPHFSYQGGQTSGSLAQKARVPLPGGRTPLPVSRTLLPLAASQTPSPVPPTTSISSGASTSVPPQRTILKLKLGPGLKNIVRRE